MHEYQWVIEKKGTLGRFKTAFHGDTVQVYDPSEKITVNWLGEWRRIPLEEKYKIFSAPGGAELAKSWNGEGFMCLEGYKTPLYIALPHLYFAAFADLCCDLAIQAKEVEVKRKYLIKAREQITEAALMHATFSDARWVKSKLLLDIDKLIKQLPALPEMPDLFTLQRGSSKYSWEIEKKSGLSSLKFKMGSSNNVDLNDVEARAPLTWSGLWNEIPVAEKYNMFASGGLACVKAWDDSGLMRLNGHSMPLYVASRHVFYAAFAQICFNLAQATQDIQAKRKYLTEAKKYITEAVLLRAYCPDAKWLKSPLFKEINVSYQLLPPMPASAEPALQKTPDSGVKALSASLAQVNVTPTQVAGVTSSVTTVGGHAITFEATLGEGASGVVFKGTWCGQGVAIKRFHASQLRGDELREFLKEASFMMDLNSPYLVKMHDVVAQAPYFGMVMEYMPYGSLYQVLGSDAELPWDKRYVIAMDILYGVAALHSRDIIHRDIKSLNVLIGDGFRAKLADFGQATLRSSSQSAKSRRTETGAVGTVAWLPPEVVRDGAECSKETDMYSVGVLLWELFTRLIPYANAPNMAVMVQWISQGKREDLSKITSPKVAKLVQWCWNENPKIRPTVQEAIKEIDEATPKHVSQAVPRAMLFSQ